MKNIFECNIVSNYIFNLSEIPRVPLRSNK